MQLNQPEPRRVPAKDFEPETNVSQGSILPAGTIFAGRYEIAELLSHGSMVNVYRVKDQYTNLTYALKVIPERKAISPEQTDRQAIAMKRAEHEAVAWKELSHSNIVATYDVGRNEHGSLYFVTDLVIGNTLQSLLRQEVLLHEERALGIFAQLAEALAYAHSNGRTHRNLKPGNILLRNTPSGHDLVKVSDFGIPASGGQHQTNSIAAVKQSAAPAGTPHYMSPEQCLTEEIDERTDIYSFGCIMFETLHGHPPFRDTNAVRVMLKHTLEVPSMPALPTDTLVTRGLKKIILRCLQKDRAHRYSSAELLLADLQNLLQPRATAPSRPFMSFLRSLCTIPLLTQRRRILNS